MSIFKGLVRATPLSLVVGVALVFITAADATSFEGESSHSSGFGHFHGGFAGDRGHGDAFRTSRFEDRDRRVRDRATDRAVQFRDWQNRAWVGIGPDYDRDPYGSYWSFYCDPGSPNFEADACGGY